jgi:two-component system nitrogen regulation response regulator GlnG
VGALFLAKKVMTTPKKVMIVDDEPDIVGALEAALEGYGYKLVCFTDPLQAIEEFKSNSQDYALVISDIKMPGMDGFEFARNVKETRGVMPVVLMTAYEISDSEFSSMLPPTVAAELLRKPFSNAQLVGIVKKYVGITEQY